MNEIEKQKIQAQIQDDKEHAEYNGPDRMVASTEIQEEMDKNPTSNFKLMTQFSALNSAFDGFKEGNTIVIAGHTNHGKTDLAVDFAQHFIKNGVNVAWFNFETSTKILLDRFKRKCDGELPLFYLPRERKESFKWFMHKIKEVMLKHSPKVIFIDNLSGLTDMKDMDNANLSSNYSVYVGAVMKKVVDLAIQYNIIIFLLVDPRKAEEDQVLSLSDVARDSSLITSKPDAVLTIWHQCKRNREGYDYFNTSWLNILKNREYGEKGKIKLTYENWKFKETM
jgi:predicted ATP-dependent serine protease